MKCDSCGFLFGAGLRLAAEEFAEPEDGLGPRRPVRLLLRSKEKRKGKQSEGGCEWLVEPERII